MGGSETHGPGNVLDVHKRGEPRGVADRTSIAWCDLPCLQLRTQMLLLHEVESCQVVDNLDGVTSLLLAS